VAIIATFGGFALAGPETKQSASLRELICRMVDVGSRDPSTAVVLADAGAVAGERVPHRV
jgi:hypothetical protein